MSWPLPVVIHGAKVSNFPEKMRNQLKILIFLRSQEHFHAVEHEDAALTALPDLVAIEEFELPRSFIVFVLDADASFPFLDLARLCPQSDVNRLWAVEHQAGG